MCYGCTPTCDNCRPKMVRCDSCGRTNFLTRDQCFFCEAPITQAMKDRAVEEWKAGVRLAGPPARPIERNPDGTPKRPT